MEPLSTLSLACNVIQLVDYSVKTARFVYKTYNSTTGETQENVELRDRAATLTRLLVELEVSRVSCLCSRRRE